jgi:hypothetical protein
LVPSLL